VGKQKEMEMQIVAKENACKIAARAEKEAKAAIAAERSRLQKIIDQENLELLKSAGMEMKTAAIRIARYIASLQDDLCTANVEMMKLPLSDVSNHHHKASKNGKGKKHRNANNRCSL
jgi:hypothetical protein